MEKLTPAQRRVVDALDQHVESYLRIHKNNFGTKCYRLLLPNGHPIMNFRLSVVDSLINKNLLYERFPLSFYVNTYVLDARIPNRKKYSKMVEAMPLRRANRKLDPKITGQQSFDFEKKKSRIYVQMPRGK